MRTFPDFSELLKDHSVKGWDGAEAPAVSPIALEQARLLLLALPADVSNPELAVDPDDAAISLEWYAGPSRVFSVSVGVSSRLACAGIDGTFGWHGIAPFDGVRLPEFILQGIRRVFV